MSIEIPPPGSPAPHPPGGPVRSTDDVLPPVTPPSAGFILQLFFIPLVIVAIVVVVWLLFSWIARAGNDPRDLVANLKKLNDSSWQSALSLAEQLKNPEYGALKQDHKLAGDLAGILSSELRTASDQESRIQLRIFLCRALGEFRVDDGLDALLQAARQQQKPAEVLVRAAAVEALTVLASNLSSGHQELDPRIQEVLLAASREQSAAADEAHQTDELRSRAAFALGTFDNAPARDRLAVLLDDAYPNVRYNAATGLARHGDQRSIRVLLEMLDPASAAGLVDEVSPGEKDQKRASIQLNAVRAAFQLLRQLPPTAAENPTADPASPDALRAALEQLSQTADFPPVRTAAAEARQRLADLAEPRQ